MNETRRNLGVGLFVLIGLLACAALIVLYGQDQLWFRSQAYTLMAKFPRATGIRVGTQVTVGGIQVGAVRKLEFVSADFAESGVYVTIAFQKDYAFHTGTSAKTVEPGLGMGRPPIDVVPGPKSGSPLASGDVIPGQIATAVESLIPQDISNQVQNVAEQLSKTAKALQPVLDDLHALLQPRAPENVDLGSVTGNLSSAVARLDSSLKHINTVLGDQDTQDKFAGAVDNLYTMTEDGKQITTNFKTASEDVRTFAQKANKLADTAQTTIGDAKSRYDEVATALMGNLDQLAGVLTDFQSISASITRGEGTLGKAVRDDRLYESMVLTFQRLAGATEDMRVLLQDWQKGRIRVGL